MGEFLIGTTAAATADVSLMKEAGLGWVRQDFECPFVDRIGGTLSEGYLRNREQAGKWKAAGLGLMGITPLPGLGRWKAGADGQLRLVFESRFPAWFGEIGSAGYLEKYRAICGFLAEDLKGVVGIWQVANELDIEIFAGPMDLRMACDFIVAGARGLKEGDKSATVGTNSVYDNRSFYLYGRLYGQGAECLDYCGVDSYFGSWRSGGPENWAGCIRELLKITGKKVLVNEWGFAAKGEVMSLEERVKVESGAMAACQVRKWQHGWRGGHSEELQAAYVREMFRIFREFRGDLVGAFLYRWEDQATCWQCGRADCPLETAWGIVGADGRRKAGYEAFCEGAAGMRE